MKRTTNFSKGGEAYFDQRNCLGMLSEIPVRKLEFLDFESSYNYFMKTFEGILEVIEISKQTTYDDVMESMTTYMERGHNILVRAFLINNMFSKDDTFFGKIDLKDLIKPQWEYLGFKESTIYKMKTQESLDIWNQFIKNCRIIVHRMLMYTVHNPTFFHSTSMQLSELSYLMLECSKMD